MLCTGNAFTASAHSLSIKINNKDPEHWMGVKWVRKKSIRGEITGILKKLLYSHKAAFEAQFFFSKLWKTHHCRFFHCDNGIKRDFIWEKMWKFQQIIEIASGKKKKNISRMSVEKTLKSISAHTQRFYLSKNSCWDEIFVFMVCWQVKARYE